MGVILFFGVGVGFVAAIVATAFLARRLLAASMPGGPGAAPQRRTIWKGAIGGAVIGLGPALLLGTVVGATLGGTYGAALAGGARDSGALMGVVVGVFAVATVLLYSSIALGTWIGRRIAAAGEIGPPPSGG